MLFYDYVGVNSKPMVYLNNLIPGIQWYIVVIAVFYSIILFSRLRKFDVESDKIISQFIILGLISFFLFGNMIVSIILFAIIFSLVWFTRNTWKTAKKVSGHGFKVAQKYMPKLAKVAGTATKAEWDLVKKEKHEKHSDKAETALAEVEAITSDEDEQIDEVVGEEAEEAVETKTTLQEETKEIQKNASAVNKIVEIVGGMEEKLTKANNVEDADNHFKEYMKTSLHEMLKLFNIIFDDEEKIFSEFKNFLKKTGVDVDDTKKLISHMKKLSGASVQVAKLVRRKLGNRSISMVETVLKNKKKKLNALYVKLKKVGENESVKQAVQQQMAVLKQEIGLIQNQLPRLKSMKEQMLSVVNDLNNANKSLIPFFKQFIKLESDIQNTQKDLLTKHKTNYGLLKKLKSAIEEFKQVINKLEGEEIAETVSVEATESLGKFFEALDKLRDAIAKINSEDLMKFTDEQLQVISNAEQMEPIIGRINQGYKNMDKAYNQLKKACNTITNKMADNDERTIDEMREQIDNLAVNGEQQRIELLNKVAGLLQKVKEEISQLLQVINTARVTTKNNEQIIFQQLTNGIKASLNKKKQLNETFTNQANQIEETLGEAQQNAKEAQLNR